MDWLTFALSVLSLVLGGGWFVDRQAKRRKANAEAKGAEIQNESASVEALKEALHLLQEQLTLQATSLNEKDQTIARLEDEKTKYKLRLAALYDDMCVHKGCKLRKPHQGQGGEWYQAHKDDPSLGCDYLSVETLLRRFRAEQAGGNGDAE